MWLSFVCLPFPFCACWPASALVLALVLVLVLVLRLGLGLGLRLLLVPVLAPVRVPCACVSPLRSHGMCANLVPNFSSRPEGDRARKKDGTNFGKSEKLTFALTLFRIPNSYTLEQQQ